MGKKYSFVGDKNKNVRIGFLLLEKNFEKTMLREMKSPQNNAKKSCFSLLLTIFLMVFMSLTVKGQVTVSGANSGNGSYTTLGAAFTAIGTAQSGANIVISITNNTTETAIASLGAGTWSSVTISPSGGAWTVTGNLASELIRFNGADNVTINGLNSGGNGLTISNTSTSATAGTSTIKFQTDAINNTITNCTVLGSTTVPNATTGGVIYFATGTTTGNDGNTISNCNIGPAGATLPSKLIYASGSTSNATIGNSGITITNCNLYDYFLTSGCAAVYIVGGNMDWTVTNNKMYQTGPRTFTANGIMYGIHYSDPTYGGNVQFTGNTIGYASSSGTGTLTLLGSGVVGQFQGIYFGAPNNTTPANNLNDNVISDISLTSSTGSFFGIYNGIASGGGNTVNINNNTIKNITTVTTTGNIWAIFGGAATTLNCNNNAINNISRNGAGTLYGLSYGAGVNVTANGNTITNLSSTNTASTAAIAGIFSNAVSVNEIVGGNTIAGLTSSSTSAQPIYGITTGTGSGNKTIQNNNLNNLSLPNTGAGSIYGIMMATGGTLNEVSGTTVNSFSGGTNIYGISMGSGTTNTVYKNKVYGLSSSVVSPSVQGISISNGTTNTVYNNYIGDLTTPSANAANPLNGIYISGGTNVNVYYNTVRLNASSTGALFGSSAVYAATGPTVDFRNNIFVNESTVAGAGLAAVYRRSSAILTTYASTSNNNLFYGNTIFTDGTNTDATLAAFKTRLGNRDVLSVNENPTFVSTLGSDANYLHINTTVPTQIESGGAPITSLIADFDGDTRNGSTPDIGADEFTGVVNDFTGPIIAHTPDTACISGIRVISATITDATGVPVAGTGLPVAYWRINSGAYTAAVGTYVASGVYNFTIGAGSVDGDFVTYYFVAQDMVATPNVSVYPSLGAAGFSFDSPAVATPPTTPVKLLTPLAGVYTVGVGGNYPTLTAAVAEYNVRCLAGSVTFSLLDANYSAGETFPIAIQQNADTSPTKTLTIKPASGVTATISGNLTSELIQFNGADYVTIDGLNAGGSSLTITNTNTSATAGNIKFQNDATINTITNCTVLGSTTVVVVPNTNPGGVIFFGTGTLTGNDGNTISNCKITAAGANLPSKLIGSIGSTGSAAIANSGNTITNCELYDYFFPAGYSAAVYVGAGSTDWTVTNNRMYQTTTRTFTATGILYGIVFNSPTVGENAQITGNTFGYANNLGTGNLVVNGSAAQEVQGVYFISNPAAANASNISNNTFANISLTSSSGALYGIYNGITAASGATVNITGNTIKNITTITSTGNLWAIYGGIATTLNLSNNTIDNITRNGAGIFYGINYGAAANVTVNSNSITNLSSTSTSSTADIAGIFSNVASVVETVNGNTINSLTSSSTGNQKVYGITTGTGAGSKKIQNNTLTNISVPNNATGAIYGIRLPSGNAAHTISGNTVGSISGPNSGGGNGINGILISAGTGNNVYNNKVYGLTGPGAASGVIGFAIIGGTNYNVYNNIIGDLTTPIATDGGLEPHLVIGINAYGYTTMNMYNNTIVLNGTASGTNFGSSALYVAGNLTLRNNILINNLPSRGAGVSVALRLAGGIANYGAASDNNLFAGTNIHTTTGITGLDATLAAFKTRVGNRDVLSVTETPTFVSTLGSDPNYLHIDMTVPTQIESGGATIAMVTNDIDGDARNGSTPDIGADEFMGIVNDLVGPVITHTPDTLCAAGIRTISATFTDATGVPTAGAGVPVAYWRINSGAYTAAVGTSVGGGVYDFIIGTGSVSGDTVNYYFVAQDNVATPNVSVYPSLGAGGFSFDSPAVATPPTPALTLKTPMTGTYTVGVGGNYTTLTAAVADYNIRCLDGAVIFSLLDTTYPAETYPISILQNNDASATNTLTIKPASGIAATISNNVAELIQFNGADYVIFDGVNSGGSSLTISNASTSSAANASTFRFMADATNNTITNCTVLGSNTTNVSTNGGVIFFGTGTANGNDSNTISYCNIGPVGAFLPVKLIYSSGTNTSENACNSEITITGCNLYDFFISNNYSAAVYASIGSSAWTIANNKVYQTGLRTFTSGYTMYGIYFSNSVYGNNVRITDNIIGYASNLSTGNLDISGNVPGCFTGIYNLTAAGASSPCFINGNTIANVTLNSTSNGTIYGINNAMITGTTNTINIEGNTIKNISTTGNTGNFYGIYGGTAFTLNCNNNVIDNLSRTAAGILYGINYTQCTNATFDSNVITGLNSTSTTSTSNYTAIYTSVASGTEVFTNNTISNLSSSSTASQAINGIYCLVASTGNRTFRNNTIRNFTLPAAGTGQLYGIRMTAGGPSNEISDNTIHTFTGGSTINGINVGGGATNNVFQNKIYGLGTSTASTAVYGINLSGGTTHNLSNNIIGDLTATAGHLAAGTANQVVGVNGTNSITTLNLYNNTVKIGSTSSGVNFGSSAVSVGSTVALTMNNNILVNTSVANGTGLSVAFRKPGLNTYAPSSNNNLFYGTAIYTDSAGATDMTLADFKIRLNNPVIGNRDLASVTGTPAFLSTVGSNANYLHIDTAVPTPIENGGVATIPAVTDDFDSEARNASTPDIGADEFSGTPITLATINAVSATSTGNQCAVNSRTITANVTAGTNPMTSVKLYYYFNGTAQTPIVMTGGTLTASTTSDFTATIPAASPANATVTWIVAVSEPATAKVTFGTPYTSVTNTWNGTAWSTGFPPTATEKIVFAGNYSSTTDLTGCSCQVNSGNVVINPTHTLTLTNDVTVSGGSLTFGDTGSLLQINNVVNTGNIIYKRKTTPLKQYDYTYWSSPVANAPLSQLATNSLFYAFDPIVNNWAQQSAGTTMVNGQGYIGRAPSGLDYSSPQIVETIFTGVPNNGTVTTPIAKGAGILNLIGNPYPSAIDIDLFLTDPANSGIVDGTIYLWTHNTPLSSSNPGNDAYNYTVDDYAKYNLTGGVATASPALTGGVVPTGKIASGQGFFIDANATLANGNYSASFKNSMRIPGNNIQFFRSNQTENNTNPTTVALEKHRLWVSLSNTAGAYNQALVGYVEGATNGMDRLFDGKTLASENRISIYSMLANNKLSIQGRSLPFSAEDVVPIGYTTSLTGIMSITLENFDGLFADQNVYLFDRTTGMYHDLKASAFSFTTTSGTFNDRFELRFTASTLGVDAPDNTADIRVVTKPQQISVLSGNPNITGMEVYDLTGKLLYSKKSTATGHFIAEAIPASAQMLIVKVVLDDKYTVVKKVLMP